MLRTVSNGPRFYTAHTWMISKFLSFNFSRPQQSKTHLSYIKERHRLHQRQFHQGMPTVYLHRATCSVTAPIFATPHPCYSQVCELSNQQPLITLTWGCISAFRGCRVRGHILRPRVLCPTLCWTSWGWFGSTILRYRLHRPVRTQQGVAVPQAPFIISIGTSLIELPVTD